jgi:DNA-binding PucR family transcriptional regulator
MKRDQIIAATAGAAGLALLAPIAAISAMAQDAPATTAPASDTAAPGPDAKAVSDLVTAINAQLATLAPDAKQSDVEAAIIFALDQAQAPNDVVQAALSSIKSTTTDKKVQLALSNVAALKNRLADQGTGGLADSGDAGDTGPQLDTVGGGTSDYTPTT